MSANETPNGPITNADLWGLITNRFDGLERRMGMVERRVGLAPDQQQQIGSRSAAWRLTLLPVLVGCAASGLVSAVLYTVFT